MEFRHTAIQSIFKQLDQKLNTYLNKKSETCLEENPEDPNSFYTCINTSTAALTENYYKFDGLSLYADLRERECVKLGKDFDKCIRTSANDIDRAVNELLANLE